MPKKLRGRAGADRAAHKNEESASPGRLPRKLVIPQAINAIARRRLFNELDQRASVPVTWVHAPPGAGKTVLLSTYVRARHPGATWYSVDITDRDVQSLVAHSRLAVKAVV